MKKSKVLLVIIILSLLLSGCAPSATMVRRVVTEEAKIAYMRDTGVFHIPVIADLEVSQTKITGTASGSNDDLYILRVRAVNNALAANNADVLLEPRFAFESTSRGTTVNVSGFPANYRNFRSITERDSLLIKNIYQLMRASTYIPQ